MSSIHIGVCAGICNKLRILVGYPEVFDEVHFYWILSERCPGEPAGLFTVRNTTIIPFHGHRDELPPHVELLSDSLDERRVMRDLGIRSSVRELWGNVVFSPAVEEEAAALVGDCEIALHIRLTDMTPHKCNHRKPIRKPQAYLDLLRREGIRGRVPLACDDYRTQRFMRAALGDRLVASSVMKPTTEWRHTDFRTAVIDLAACVKAARFIGTDFSSYSQSIMHLRRQRGRRDQRDFLF